MLPAVQMWISKKQWSEEGRRVRAHPVPLSGAWVRIGTCRPCSAQLRPPAPARGDAGEGVSRQGDGDMGRQCSRRGG